MNKERLEIEGAFAFKSAPVEDERGSLIRVFDSVELFPNFNVVQASYVENPKKGTLRGLHFQTGKFAETKIIQCLHGEIWDVMVDLRPKSKTFKKYVSVQIGPENTYQGVFIPKNCAHGYLTLSKRVKLVYFMDNEYVESSASGFIWNDKALNIKWPFNPIVISEKDVKLPKFSDIYTDGRIEGN